MNFIEAMRKLQEWSEVRRSYWVKDSYIILRDYSVIDDNGIDYDFTFSDYLAIDWEEYKSICKEEPKLHSFSEALQAALKYGKRIKQSGNDHVFYIDNNRLSLLCMCNNNKKYLPNILSFPTNAIMANDWIILENEEV